MFEKSLFSNRGLGLLVIFSKDIEKSVTFYKSLGLQFERHFHPPCGDHFSSIDSNCVFEICRSRNMTFDDFDVDWQAYADVKKGLSQLVKLGYLAEAKSLAIKLMKDGSYQAEVSDEGLMADDISECLKPVIRAVKAAGGDEAIKWAGEMLKADRVGFICDKELAELRGGP